MLYYSATLTLNKADFAQFHYFFILNSQNDNIIIYVDL